MFHFTKPRYLSKWLDPVTQQTCPAYQFDVKVSDSAEEAGLSFLVEAGTALTVKVVEEAVQEDRDWWYAVLQHFLTTTASYFSRPDTVQHLERVVQHMEVSHASTEDTSLPRRIYCVPRLFQLSGGKLRVHWRATECPAGIDLPEEEETASDALAIPPVCGGQDRSAEIEEWDVEALPEEKEATDNASLVTNPDMLLERQRVKEARLKAKLAVYRAQYQMNRFYDKYGNEVSDSDSEEEEEDEDEEDEDEEEDDSFL